MAKSFKRAIACMLAVLMVAFAMPFTAFAGTQAVADYHPDIDVVFGTFYDVDTGDYESPGTASAAFDGSLAGIYDAPVTATRTVDTATGALKVSQLELTSSALTNYAGSADGAHVLATDDYFTLTVLLKNVTEVNALQVAMSYSDNIEPAGCYSYKSGKKTLYSLGTETERAAASGTWVSGGTSLLTAGSADGVYGGAINNGVAADNDCYIDNTNKFMSLQLFTEGNSYKVGAPVEATDPEVPFIGQDGNALDAYPDIIVASYAFKITGTVSAANPIVLGVYDPDNTKFTKAYEGGCYTAELAYQFNLATYAECSATPASKQMTYFGYNVNNGGGQTTTTYTVTYVDAEGTTISTETVEDGAAPASVPTLPANTAHDSYAWDGDTTAAITADTTFTIVKTTSAHNYVGVATPATCTEDGYTTYTCSICGDSYTEAGAAATGHAYGAWVDYDATNHAKTCANCGDVVYEAHVAGAAVTEAGVAPTATEDGYHYEVVSCTVCGRELSRTQVTDPALGEDYTFSAFVIDTANETAIARFVGAVTGTVDDREATVSKSVTPATCTADGSTVYTAAYDGVTATVENGGIVTVTESALGHDLGEWTETTAAVAATCTEAGSTAVETRSCSRCDYSETRGGDEVAALGHTMTPYEAVPATCLEDGSEAYWICSVCNKMFSDANGENEISNPITISALGHDMGAWTVTKEATQQAAGEKTRSCSRCDYVETEAIPALGISVTVTATTGGSVTGTVASGETKTDCAFGDTLNLVATPDEGYSFVAWEINGKSVSTSATYNSKVFADLTIEPVFAKNEVEEFTVVFYDIFKNVVSTQTVTSAAELEVPSDASMARNGFTFTGWDVDPATVTKATVINGQYEPDTAIGYTVTVEGANAEITKIAGENTTEKTGIPYDSKVTVTVEGATGFKIGDTVVSTTDSYSFYVGADVTVTAVFDDVATVNAIDIISVTPVSGNDYKYQFLATRTVADGYKVEKVGFVYGKNLEDSELDLEKAGQTSAAGTTIKVGYNNFTASVLETSLQYGLTGKTGTIKAKAFMVVSKGGKSEVIYSTLKGYNYQGGYINGLSDEEP